MSSQLKIKEVAGETRVDMSEVVKDWCTVNGHDLTLIIALIAIFKDNSKIKSLLGPLFYLSVITNENKLYLWHKGIQQPKTAAHNTQKIWTALSAGLQDFLLGMQAIQCYNNHHAIDDEK